MNDHEFLPTDEANPFERHAWDKGGAQPGMYRVLAFRPAKGEDGEWKWQHHSVRHVGLTQPEAASALEFDPKDLNEMLERHVGRLHGKPLTPTERQWAGIDPTEHDEGIPEFHQLARMKAPAGGAIVNNQYQKGGQFLARTLQSIRSVSDRLRKLARPPRKSEHDQLLESTRVALQAEHPDATALAAFADFLDENARAGGRLAREGAESHVKRGRHWPIQRAFDPNVRSVPLGHGVEANPVRDQDGNHWLEVRHPGDRYLQTPLNYSVPLRDHAHLLSLVPDDTARRALLTQMPDLPLGSSGHANHLARADDPATYDQLTQAIHADQHDATAHAALADFLQETGTPGAAISRAHALHPDLDTVGRPERRIRAAAGGTGAVKGLWSLEDETNHPDRLTMDEYLRDVGDAPVAQATAGAGANGGVSLSVLHHNPHGARIIHTAHAATADELRALISDIPQAARQGLLGPLIENGSLRRLLKGKGSRSFKLSRPAASPAVTTPLTLGELKQIEDEHTLPKNARLSPHVEQPAARAGDEHPYAANVEHITRFLDGLSKSRVQPASFRKILADDKRSDVNKFVHLTTHLGHEHQEAEKIGWYGEHLDTLDKALHKHFGWGALDSSGQLEGKHDPAAHHPELVLFKALVGATSPSQNPVDNLSSALRAWKAGAAAGDPILNAPHFNTPALKAFTDQLPAEALTPGMTPVEHAKWYAKFVEGKHATGEGVTPYAARTARIVLPSGLLLDHDAHGKTIKNPDTKGYRLKAGERVARVDLPLVDSSGAIRPKGWARYGQQTAAGILKLQNLVRSFSSKDKSQKQAYTDAAQWLLRAHTPEEFDARMKRAKMDKAVNSARVYSSGFLDKTAREAIPGTFIFGPKVGPFVLNLHSNDPRTRESFGSYLTADKWWSRTFHRYLGKLVDSGDAPSARTRGLMRKVVKEVAKHAGVTPAELQADLWYHEQNLYRLLGAKSAESYSYADAAKKFLGDTHAG